MNRQKKTRINTLSSVLLLVVLGLASSGCVDTGNEIAVKMPLPASCTFDAASNSVTVSGEAEYDGSAVRPVLTLNIDELLTKGVYMGVDSNGGQVFAKEDGYKLVGAIKSNLTTTTNYTSIGANGELRVDQNEFLIREVTYEIDNEIKGLKDFKISKKEMGGRVPPAGTASLSSIPFLNTVDLNNLKTAMGNVEAFQQGGVATLRIKAIIKGELNGGSSLSASAATFPVEVCLSGCQQTAFCNPKK